MLVEEVVEVPGLVADPEVERLSFHQVVEDHEVVDQHLVHAAYGVERVQVVLARLRLEVPGLARQEPGGRVDRLAPLLQELRDGRLGEPLDLEVRTQLTHRVGDGEVAPHVSEADGGGQVEHPRPPARGTARRSRRRQAVDPVDEPLDRTVDDDRVPGHRQVPRTVDHQLLAAGEPDQVVRPARWLAAVVGAADHQHRSGQARHDGFALFDGLGEVGAVLGGEHGRARGLAGEPDDVLELLGGVRLGQHLVEEEPRERRPVVAPARAGWSAPSPRRTSRSSSKPLLRLQPPAVRRRRVA